ncbi:MAG: gamma-glutamyltransferase [Thermoanaerobaculia bacterium]|nr:gamma-glutamyltransferase [Thermoanaerobaculia bacterium]
MRRLIAVVLLFSAVSAHPASPEPRRARYGMVASTSEIASRVGVQIMKQGGNAVDAAVAVAFALAVTWPSAGNLGGGGFMLIRKADGTSEAIDYRERAPLVATRKMYLDAQGNVIKGLSTDGYKAVAVPGTVAGLSLAHSRYGLLPWGVVVEPAQRLAQEGFFVEYHLSRSLQSESTNRKLGPWAESRRVFQRNGSYYNVGDRLVQPDLAAALARIKKDPKDFYEGETSRLILEDMQANGGLITAADLKGYQPTVRKTLTTTYRGYEIITMPPPSSGGVALIEMLQMLEPVDLKSMGWNSAAYTHTLIETMRRAFADRAAFLGDTDFAKNVPVEGLLSRKYALERRKDIDPAKATSSLKIASGQPVRHESKDTTHFTVIDVDGNAVSNTYTLNDSYGSGVTAKGTGILLNNEMDDFTSKPGVPNDYQLIQGEANAIEPRKRPLSSMTPTIVVKDRKVRLAIGSPGGPTIINTVLQVILNVIEFDMDIQEAIDAPRFHHQWLPDEIFWEPFFNADTREILEKMGHKFREKPTSLGDAQGVMINPETSIRTGASDPRLGGVPAGY